MKTLEHNEEQIKEFKDIKSQLKENGDKPISMELFKKVIALKICEAPKKQNKDANHCTNEHIVKREVSQEIEAKKYTKNNNYNNRNNNQ